MSYPPKIIYEGGPWDGKVEWRELAHNQHEAKLINSASPYMPAAVIGSYFLNRTTKDATIFKWSTRNADHLNKHLEPGAFVDYYPSDPHSHVIRCRILGPDKEDPDSFHVSFKDGNIYLIHKSHLHPTR